MATKKTATLARLNQILAKGEVSAYELMRELKAPAYVVAKLLLEKLAAEGKRARAAKVSHE